jgi:DNA-binding NtrC family response regulator
MPKMPPPDHTLEERSRVRERESEPRPGLLVLFSSVPGLQGAFASLAREPLVLGRGRSLGGRELADARVSSRHLEVRLSGAQAVELRDLGSRNGSFLDGESISAARATPDSVIRIGGTLLQLLPDLEPLLGLEPDDAVQQHFAGSSPEARAVRRRLRELAPFGGAVLIGGPPGAGKEQAARALHEARAPRRPLVALNCSVLTDELAASELFGHVRGAFTGANEAREGAFRRAHGGTLFLDEVGELPLAVQPKLLRALQEGRVRPVGGDRDIDARAWVVAATNRELGALVRSGQFRADLYSRLATAVVTIPALRERRADIVALAQRFLEDGRQLHPLAAERLLLHPWPHNARDLRAVIDLLVQQPGEVLRLTPPVEDKLRADLTTVASAADDEAPGGVDARWPRSAEARADVLRELLRRHRGNVADVARAIGKRTTSVRRWLSLYEIDADQFRD